MTTWKRTDIQCLLGLLLSCMLLAGLFKLATDSYQLDEQTKHLERLALIDALQIIQVIEKVQRQHDETHLMLNVWRVSDDKIEDIRVIGARREIIASTNKSDWKHGDLPRKMQREEKWLFDISNELITKYKISLEERNARPLLFITTTKDSSTFLNLPYHNQNTQKIAGYVQIELTNQAPITISNTLYWVLFSPLIGYLAFVVVFQFISKRAQPSWLSISLSAMLLGMGIWGSLLVVSEHADNQARAHYTELEETIAKGQARLDHVDKLLGHEQGESTFKAATIYAYHYLNSLDRHLPNEPEIYLHGVIDRDAASKISLWSVQTLITKLSLPCGIAVILYLLFASGLARKCTVALTSYAEAYLWLLPAALFMSAVVLVPLGYGLAISMTEMNIYNSSNNLTSIWAGFDNYSRLLDTSNIPAFFSPDWQKSPQIDFYWELYITALWILTSVLGSLTLGIIVALLLVKLSPIKQRLYTTVLIIPWAMPTYVTALIFGGLWDLQSGPFNEIIAILTSEPITSFSSIWPLFWLIVGANIWLSFPFVMLVVLAALQSLDRDVLMSALVDGCSPSQRFRWVIWPMLKPFLSITTFVLTLWSLNGFNLLYLLSNASGFLFDEGINKFLVHTVQPAGFHLGFWQYRYGYSAAYGVLVMIVLASLFYFYQKHNLRRLKSLQADNRLVSCSD